MPARYIHEGKAVDYFAPAPTKAGDVVVQNDLVGIAKLDIAPNALGSLHVSGVFDLPKATGETLIAGAKVYWDKQNKHATPNDDGGNNPYVGKAVDLAGTNAELVRVRLDQ